MALDVGLIAFLLVAGFAAAFIDSIVGGGGAISIPALLAAGLPPHLALGTNKLAATGASLTATTRYVRAGLVDRRLALVGLPLALVASALGAWVVLQVEPGRVRELILVVMAAMTVYVLVKKDFGLADKGLVRTGARLTVLALLVVAIAFYDGLLGPGTGSLLIFALVGVAGLDFLKAAANGRLLNFGSNLGSLLLFAALDNLDMVAGLTMMSGMLVGAWMGSQFGIRHGSRWIKPLFLVVTAALMVRLLFG